MRFICFAVWFIPPKISSFQCVWLSLNGLSLFIMITIIFPWISQWFPVSFGVLSVCSRCVFQFFFKFSNGSGMCSIFVLRFSYVCLCVFSNSFLRYPMFPNVSECVRMFSTVFLCFPMLSNYFGRFSNFPIFLASSKLIYLA